MDDLDILARDFGFGSGGKSKPMRSAQFSDVFGEPAKFTPNTKFSPNDERSSTRDLDYDSIFNQDAKSVDISSSKTSSAPVYDKPVYDEDIFEGLPGLKSNSAASSARYDNAEFAGISSPRSSKGGNQSSDLDDLLGNLGRSEKSTENIMRSSVKSSSSSKGFDDLLAGFGSGVSAATHRPITESNLSSVPVGGSKHGSVLDEPYVVSESLSTQEYSSSGLFPDPLEEISKHGKFTRVEASSGGGRGFDDLDPLNRFGKTAHSFSRGRDKGGKEGSPSRSASPQFDTMREQNGNSSFRYSESNIEKKTPLDNFQEPPSFEMPKFSTDFRSSFDQTAPQYFEASFQVDMSPTSSGLRQQSDDVWLNVSEIPLFTQPTAAPPPSRPPPPIPHQRAETFFSSSSSKKKDDKFNSPSNLGQHSQSSKLLRPVTKSQQHSHVDELEDFARGRSQNSLDESADMHSSEETNAFSAIAAASAAAMKEAMEKAEAKFRHAKEVREREHAKFARFKEPVQLEKDEELGKERDLRETEEILEHERKQKEEEEREERRRQRERERSRETERQKGRQAVERANREARERAGAHAREKAATESRLRTERAAVEKASAEARERAERVAVQRAQAEARERAAAEARERAERAATEARQRATASETKEKELREKAFAARAAAEARERAAVEARERAAAATAAKMNQQRNDDDLESFFNMGRATSAPKARANSNDPFSTQQFQNKGGPEPGKRTSSSSGASSNMKKASSTTNIDDLSSIFGVSFAGEFPEVEGETEERRRARLDRHQRTQERAAKAVAEKNQRDLEAQREQEERHRISGTLDIEIKRWAAGKEGNLRALLSTLQYVLWPECGWQPVSLTDLINGASVKKVYRKATLCIHPDKVQQKGANLQQKYVAEKVFDLLKEAWNKFNSEELF